MVRGMGIRRRLRRRFDLSKAVFILPNLFTVSSIFCGFYAAVTAAGATGDSAGHDLYRACIAVLFAMAFDAVDGRVARLTKTQSEFGVQMDSLADVISFGAVPGLIAWHWGLSKLGDLGLFVCFLYCACGTIRLARFNVMAAADDGPSTYFLGLPIPAAAGLLVAAIIASVQMDYTLTGEEMWPPFLMVALGALMVSNVRFPTFKATRLTAKTGAILALIFGSLIYIGAETRPSIAILALMLSYLAYGIAEDLRRVLRSLRDDEEEEDELEEETFSTFASDVLIDDEEEELID